MRGLRLPWAAITKPPTSNPASPGSAGFGSAVRGSRAPAGVGGDCMPGYRGKHRAKRALYATGRSIDDRFGAAKWGEKALRKAFPDHWSFFLGEIALYSFIILVLTGTFLTLFFKPSMTQIVYHGSYVKLDGLRMSEAYASTLHISFDIRGGLLIRQIHHWAAVMFVGAIALHALRLFFTGAFRKPRELNWVIGTTMFALAAVEGFAGYSLPDD